MLAKRTDKFLKAKRKTDAPGGPGPVRPEDESSYPVMTEWASMAGQDGASVSDFLDKVGSATVIDAALRRQHHERHGWTDQEELHGEYEKFLAGGKLPSDESPAYEAYLEDRMKAAGDPADLAASVDRGVLERANEMRPYMSAAAKGGVTGTLLGSAFGDRKAKLTGLAVGSGLGVMDQALKDLAQRRGYRRTLSQFHDASKQASPADQRRNGTGGIDRPAFPTQQSLSQPRAKLNKAQSTGKHEGVTTDRHLAGSGPSIKAYTAGLRGPTNMPSPMPNRHD